MALTTFAPMLDLAIQVSRSHGVDVKPLLRELAIDPRIIKQPDSRLRLEQVLRFYEGIDALIEDKSAWLQAGEFWHPDHLGTLGYAWLSSRTLFDAFDRLKRFSKLVSEGFHLDVMEDDKQQLFSLAIRFTEPERATQLRIDGFLSLLLAMVQANAGKEFHPLSIAIAHPAPKHTAAYFRLFQCPVEFDTPNTQFTLNLQDAMQELTQSPSALSELHDQLMQKYLSKLSDDNIIERVKKAIIEELPSGRISDARIARAMYMNRRTLQRRLQAQGTTFKTLLTEVRMNLADQFLRDTRKSLSEISFLLGFSELSAFSRAFKRWKGHPPRAYRDELDLRNL